MTLPSETNWIILGKIGKPYGIRGFVKIYSYTYPKEKIFDYSKWYLGRNSNAWQEMVVVQNEIRVNSLLAKFAGYDSPEIAKELNSASIAIPEHELPKLDTDEFYHYQLIGCQVINQNNIKLGVVDYLFDVAEQDMLFVKGSREYVIPFKIPVYIVEVNLKEKLIKVDWDEHF